MTVIQQMTSSGVRVWKVIKPHLPSIKFKKRSQVSSEAAIGLSAHVTRGVTGVEQTQSLPKRYQRKPITPLEMEIISSGGVSPQLQPQKS